MKYKYIIEGLDCPNCAMKLSQNMKKIDGITDAKINFLTEKLTVESEISEGELYALLVKCAKDFDRGVEIHK